MKRLTIGSCLAIVLLAAISAPAGATPASSWTERQLSPGPGDEWGPPLSGISCPNESLCVAVGGLNTVAFSQTPTGSAAKWHVVSPTYDEPRQSCLEDGESVAFCSTPRGSLNGVSCASESLCVAVGYEGSVYVSTDPTGGADAWSVGDVNEGGDHGATHLIAVSCPSPALCVAVSGGSNNSNGGKVLTSTNPAAGQWQVTRLGSLDFRGVSCGTPSLCVAVAREGRIFVSTNPTGGASAWVEAGTPGGPGDLEGVACVSTLLCAAGNLTGNILSSTDPTAGASWSEADAGGSVQITGVSCPTASRCVAVDNNGDVLTSTDPTGGAGSWRFENLVPFRPTENGKEMQPPRNALFAASCASTSLCALAGPDGRLFTATDPFSVSSDPPGRRRARKARPRTVIVFAEHFWKVAVTRRHRVRARFRFYSPTRARGFECKRDRGRYRPCDSPLRYWAPRGRHVLRVRAIGPTGLRGPAAIKHFRVRAPLGHPHSVDLGPAGD